MPTPGQELSSIDFESMIGGPLIAVVNAQTQAAMATVKFIKDVGFDSIPNPQDPTQQITGKPINVKFTYEKETAPAEPMSGGEILSVTVANGGTGYSQGSPVTFGATPTDGIAATGTANVETGGVITSVTITNKGKGYKTAPTPVFAPGGATGSTAVSPVIDAKPARNDPFQLEVPILTMLPIPFIRVESVSIDFNAKINSVEFTKTDDTFKLKTELGGEASYPFIASAKLKVSTSYKKNTASGTNVERTYSMAVNVRAVQDEMPAGMERILGILEDAITSQPAPKASTP